MTHNPLDNDDPIDYEEIAWLWATNDTESQVQLALLSSKELADECANAYQNDEPLDRDRLIHAFAQLKREDQP